MNILEEMYFQATTLAKRNNQVVGEKNDYYVTLQQLESLAAFHLQSLTIHEDELRKMKANFVQDLLYVRGFTKDVFPDEYNKLINKYAQT